MSIFYICGKPGGGKSYLGVKQIIEELMDPNSQRFIVTNIILKLDEIAAWLHEHCKHEVNLFERIRILDDSETAEFWLYEPHKVYDKRVIIERRQRSYNVPDFSQRGTPGTLYVIDEVHNYFGARDWQATGADCTWFLSQHRKLLCDVVFITQHPEQTDKALRRLAQEYMSVRNLSREPILGFNLASWFGAFRYVRTLNSPQSPNPGVFETGFVDLKPNVYGKFYDTMAGVGIAGRVVPAQTVKRGRSLWWLLVPVGAFVAGLYLLFTHITEVNAAIAHGMAHALFKGSTNLVSEVGLPSVPASSARATVTKAIQTVTVPAGMQILPLDHSLRSQDQAGPSNEVCCVGYCAVFHEPMAYLSDGRTVGPEDGLQTISRHFVVISGHRYPVRARPIDSGTSGGATPDDLSGWGQRSVSLVSSVPSQLSAGYGYEQSDYQAKEYYDRPSIVGPPIHGIEVEPPHRINGILQMQGQSIRGPAPVTSGSLTQ